MGYAPYHALDNANDVEIIRHLALTADLKELIQSIANNGYISIEPLIVIKSTQDNYIVLEGNRRLSASGLVFWQKDESFLAQYSQCPHAITKGTTTRSPT